MKKLLSLLSTGVFLMAVPPSLHAAHQGLEGAREALESAFGRVATLFGGSAAGDQEEVRRLIRQIMDENFNARLFAKETMFGEWGSLSNEARKEVREALVVSIGNRLFSEFKNYPAGGFPELHFIAGKDIDLYDVISGPGAGERAGVSVYVVKQPDGTWRIGRPGALKPEEVEDYAALTYTLTTVPNPRELTFNLLKRRGETWMVSDVRIDGVSLLEHYYRRCRDLLNRYSMPFLIAELAGRGYMLVDDFETGELGKLPKDYIWRVRDAAKNKPYAVREEHGNRYLAAIDTGESVTIGKELKWDIRKYPFLSFRWRVKSLPPGGDERYGNTNDSAASISVLFKLKFGIVPEAVKYVWSTTLPAGTATRRSGTGRPWVIVAEGGEEHLGEWRTYVFNVYEAYSETFGGDPPATPHGIGILTDANATRSLAVADYDDIRILQSADATSGIARFLDAD